VGHGSTVRDGGHAGAFAKHSPQCYGAGQSRRRGTGSAPASSPQITAAATCRTAGHFSSEKSHVLPGPSTTVAVKPDVAESANLSGRTFFGSPDIATIGSTPSCFG